MKKSVQLIALVAVALLSSCSGGEKDKATAEKVDEKQRVKLASVTARPVDQIQEYTATVQAEVKNNIAPSSPLSVSSLLTSLSIDGNINLLYESLIAIFKYSFVIEFCLSILLSI